VDGRARIVIHGLAVLLSLAVVSQALAGLKVYYLRHAESGANAEHRWKSTPKDQWPPYVGNADAFSPAGEAQLPGVMEKLGRHSFDFIAVSPLWRTRHTVLPYLRATGQTAEIWPELAEFHARGKDDIIPPALPPPSGNLFDGGAAIELPADEKPFLRQREGANRLCRPAEDRVQLEADRQALTERVVRLLRDRFGGTDKTVLLVGHGNAGRLLASTLAGEQRIMEQGRYILNARLWMAEEQPDGTFRLMLFNDGSWPPAE
jgi:broad specificity phosphatase PhoE